MVSFHPTIILLPVQSRQVFKDSFIQWLRITRVRAVVWLCGTNGESVFLTPCVAGAAAKKVQREQKKRVPQIHTHTHFFRPHTLKLARKPKYERTSVAKDNKMDVYAVIKKPVVTESAMKKIEVGEPFPHS